MNAWHAIADRNANDGLIEVFLHRQPALSESLIGAIDSITFKDNGIGFTDTNFESFTTADSTYKTSLGGKGIGRLMYLKVFENVDVESNFLNGESWSYRSFRFERTARGLFSEKLEPSQRKFFETLVKLRHVQESYEKSIPLEFDDFCDRTLEHLLALFLSEPKVKLIAHDTGKPPCDFSKLAKVVIADAVKKSTIQIEEFQFTCNLIKLYQARDSGHRIVLCAHDREVTKEKLSTFITELSKPLVDEIGSYVVVAYVQSEFLDQRVSQERTDILFDEDESSMFGTVTKKRLFDVVVERVEEFAKSEIALAREEKLRQI